MCLSKRARLRRIGATLTRPLHSSSIITSQRTAFYIDPGVGRASRRGRVYVGSAAQAPRPLHSSSIITLFEHNNFAKNAFYTVVDPWCRTCLSKRARLRQIGGNANTAFAAQRTAFYIVIDPGCRTCLSKRARLHRIGGNANTAFASQRTAFYIDPGCRTCLSKRARLHRIGALPTRPLHSSSIITLFEHNNCAKNRVLH
jgi:hypothetical protein